MRKPLYNALAWLFIVVSLTLLLIPNIKNLQLEVDVLSLLPESTQGPWIEKAQAKQKSYSSTLLFLISGNTQSEAYKNANTLNSRLESSNLFSAIHLKITAENFSDNYQGLYPYRHSLLTAQDKKLIQQNPEGFIQQSLQALFSPLGAQRATSLSTDPLFTFNNYLESQSQEQFDLEQEVAIIKSKGEFYALIRGEINSNYIKAPKALLDFRNDNIVWAKDHNIKLLMTGLPFYNAMAADSAKSEISTVGLFSLLSIIILMIFSFRSTLPLSLALLCIGSGVLGAFTICLLLFEKLHMITLVFGSSLIGVSVDYSFHYLTTFFNGGTQSSYSRLKSILPSITLGMFSSVLAYGALAASPFPGLKQIAIFSAVGLLIAFFSVVLLMPFILRNFTLRHTLPLQRFFDFYNHSLPSLAKKFRFPLIFTAIIFIASGLFNIKLLDNIRLIQGVSPELRHQENQIKALINKTTETQFFLVTAEDTHTLLQQELQLTEQLEKAVNQDILSGYQAISTLYPAKEQQTSNYQTLNQHMIESGRLKSFLQALSMQEKNISQILKDFRNSAHKTMDLNKWYSAQVKGFSAQFLGCENNICASSISLQGIKNLTPLKQLADGNSQVIFVDPIETINQLLRNYRQFASWMILLSIMTITVILILVISFKSALIISATPVAAILLTVSLLSLLQIPLTLFHVFALLLVLGISLDYAIFQHLGADHQQSTALAILLSLLTSLLAFGLLSLSSTAVVHAFGLTLAIGITFAYLVTPLLPTQKQLRSL